MIKFIKNIIKKINISEPKKILGRWNIDYCYSKLNKKVDLSNEDHCGPCGKYILSKRDKIENEHIQKFNVNKYNKNNKNNNKLIDTILNKFL